MRQCLACRERLPRERMLRLVVDDEGRIWPDPTRRAHGRGAYLCMRRECLARMSDRKLRPMKAKFAIILPQWESLRQRIRDALDALIAQGFSRLRAKAFIGRDAIMHRLWKNQALVLFIAEDAGDALRRQLEAALEKRAQAGLAAELVEMESADWLGGMFGRERVAVAGLECSPLAKRLAQYCVWRRHVKESG